MQRQWKISFPLTMMLRCAAGDLTIAPPAPENSGERTRRQEPPHRGPIVPPMAPPPGSRGRQRWPPAPDERGSTGDGAKDLFNCRALCRVDHSSILLPRDRFPGVIVPSFTGSTAPGRDKVGSQLG